MCSLRCPHSSFGSEGATGVAILQLGARSRTPRAWLRLGVACSRLGKFALSARPPCGDARSLPTTRSQPSCTPFARSRRPCRRRRDRSTWTAQTEVKLVGVLQLYVERSSPPRRASATRRRELVVAHVRHMSHVDKAGYQQDISDFYCISARGRVILHTDTEVRASARRGGRREA